MRRDPLAIIAAHRFDPDRRELYVEGSKDKVFLEWVVADRRSPHASIILIDFVDLPDISDGGNKARLLAFMRIAENQVENIRGLIDSDSDTLLDTPPSYPSNIWVTDWRSLESYVMTVECLDTALRLGCDVDYLEAENLFQNIAEIARKVSAIRYVSESENLRLPVSSYRWTRYLKCRRKGGVSLDIEGAIRSLMQNAGINLSQLHQILDNVDAAEQQFAELDDLHVIHGKDFMKILTLQLQEMGVKIDDAGRLMWTSFRREDIRKHMVLSEVVDYLSFPTHNELAQSN